MARIPITETGSVLAAQLLSNSSVSSEPVGSFPRIGVDKSIDVKEILSILEANHVPLLWIKQTGVPVYKQFLASDAFRHAVEAEQAQLESLRAQALLLRDEFARYGIEIAFIKAVDITPSFPYKTGNQDILVRPNQVNLARRLLRKLGHIEVRHIHERKKYLYRTFKGGKEGISVHLHEHVGWEGNTFIDADTLWARMVVSQVDPELLIPSAEDVVLITTAHAFDENKEVRLVDLVKLRHCIMNYDLDWDYMDAIALNRGWLYQFYAALYIFDYVHRLFWDRPLLPDMILTRMGAVLRRHPYLTAYLKRKICRPYRILPFSIPFSFSKFCSYKKILDDPVLNWRERFSLVIENTLRGVGRKLGLRNQPSMLISFSGIDGSGKTSQAKALQKAFTICEVKTKYVWKRGSSSNWLVPFKWIWEKFAKYKCFAISQDGEIPKQKRERIRYVRSRWIRAIYKWMIFLELLLFYTRKVTIPLILGHVVICDRYILDHIVDWMDLLEEPYAYKSLPAWLLNLLLPSPDIGVLLEVPVQVALSRRDDELFRERVEFRIETFSRLAKKYRLKRVDANKPFEQVCDELIPWILTKYLDNHWTVLNSIFRYNNPLGPSE